MGQFVPDHDRAENRGQKEGLYRRIRMAGLLSFLPFVLASGPLGGYIVGDLLEKRFGFSAYIMPVCIVIGFAGGLWESVRLVRFILKADGDNG